MEIEEKEEEIETSLIYETDIHDTQELLNDRFSIALRRDEELRREDKEKASMFPDTEFIPNNPDYIYYKGCLKAIEMLGLTWERRENGKHIIYK